MPQASLAVRTDMRASNSLSRPPHPLQTLFCICYRCNFNNTHTLLVMPATALLTSSKTPLSLCAAADICRLLFWNNDAAAHRDDLAPTLAVVGIETQGTSEAGV